MGQNTTSLIAGVLRAAAIAIARLVGAISRAISRATTIPRAAIPRAAIPGAH